MKSSKFLFSALVSTIALSFSASMSANETLSSETSGEIIIRLFDPNSNDAPVSTSTPDGGAELEAKGYGVDVLEQLKISFDVTPENTGLLGEQVDLSTGTLTFKQTDLTIPTNGQPIEITRMLSGAQLDSVSTREFGLWSLNLPFVSSKIAKSSASDAYTTGGWATGTACSNALNMGTISGLGSVNASLTRDEYWSGDTINLGALGSASIVTETSNSTSQKVTKNNWKISCITAVDNGNRGYEGYQVTTPDGTVYKLGQRRVIPTKVISKAKYTRFAPNEDKDPYSTLDPLTGRCVTNCYDYEIANVFLMITEKVDRFGNVTTYEYNNGLLQKIKFTDTAASNQEIIEVTFDYKNDQNQETNYIHKITFGDRQWQYKYTPRGNADFLVLNEVILPRTNLNDNKKWQFDYSDFIYSTPPPYSEGESGGLNVCLIGGAIVSSHPYDIKITHPQGTVGEYSLVQTGHGRTNIPMHMLGDPKLPENKQRYSHATCYNQIALFEKRLNVTGQTNELKWSYGYNSPLGAFAGKTKPEIAGVDASISGVSYVELGDLKRTTVANPDNSLTKHYFSRKYDLYENALVATEHFDTDGTTLLQRVVHEYAFGARVGHSQVTHANYDSTDFYKRRVSTTNYEVIDGTTSDYTFVTQYSNFDLYEVPLTIAETFNHGSTANRTKTTVKTYQHDVDNWVLSQPKSVSIQVDSQPKEVSRIEYYPTNEHFGLPKKEYTFGQEIKHYTDYYANGQVKSLQYNELLDNQSGNRYQHFGNYKRGIPTSITLPPRNSQLSTTELTVNRVIDNNGWVTQTSDFNNNITNYKYDKLGRILSVQQIPKANEPSWLGTLYTWTGGTTTSQPVQTVERCTLTADREECATTAKLSTVTTFDSLMRPSLVATSGDNTTVYQKSTFNIYNKQEFESYPYSDVSKENHGVSTNYDGLQRVISTSQTGVAGSIVTNYLAGNVVKVTDAKGYITETTYLAYGKPSKEQAISIASPENVNTSIAIDVLGNIKTITQSGSYIGVDGSTKSKSQTENRYYEATTNRLCAVKRLDVGSTVYKYNNLGQITAVAEGQTLSPGNECQTSVSANDQVSYHYDNLGTQFKIEYGDGSPTRTLTHDGNGNVTAINSTGYSQTYNYNSLNLLTDENLTVSGKNMSLTYGYNDMSNLASMVYPGTTEPVEYKPNVFGQATQAIRQNSDGTTDTFVKGENDKALYYANGMIKQFTYGNGIVHKVELNTRQLPICIVDDITANTSCGTLSGDKTKRPVNLSYEYDENANITAITNGRNSNYSLSNIQYDGLNRLRSTVGEQIGIGSSAIMYDSLGNIISYSNINTENKHNFTEYHYDSNNVLMRIDGSDYSFGYDSRGNVTSNGKHTFTYNRAGQMTHANLSTINENSYVYDGFDRRIKTVNGANETEYSMYSQSGQLVYRETSKGGIEYIFLGSKLVAKVGTGVTVANEANNETSIANYKPFGGIVEDGSGNKNNRDDVGYTGHKFDTDIGLNYMQARYYDPVIGRFYSNDPVGALGHSSITHGFNRYAYANNNPYKYVDPDGNAGQLAVANAAGIGGTMVCGPVCGGIAWLGGLAVTTIVLNEAVDAYNESSESSPERAGEGEQEPSKIKVRGGRRSGGSSNPDSVEVEYPDGTMKDINPDRVKEKIPNPYVPGSDRWVKFNHGKDGTKPAEGHEADKNKRRPTEEEMKLYNDTINNN